MLTQSSYFLKIASCKTQNILNCLQYISANIMHITYFLDILNDCQELKIEIFPELLTRSFNNCSFWKKFNLLVPQILNPYTTDTDTIQKTISPS